MSTRSLTLYDATMLVMGGIVGVGIFFNPADVARAVSSEGAYMALWLAGGLAALAGAMTFAELSASYPRVGGWYVWLSEAFGRRIAFLFAWTVLLVVSTGACALVARFFAEQILALFGSDAAESRRAASWIASGAIAFVTALGALGLKSSALFQNVCMVLKLMAIGTFVVAGLGLALGPDAPPTALADGAVPLQPTSGLFAASLAVLFSYGGWQLLSYVAPSVEDPQRNLPRAIVIGVGGVVAIYFLVNLAYLRVLGLGGLAQSGGAPMAVRMANALLGDAAGVTFVHAAMAVSALGFLVATLITTPGIYVAMAREGLFVPALGRTSAATGAPVPALFTQCAFALGYLAWSHGDDAFVKSLQGAVVFAEWIFHGLAGLALIVLVRRSGGERPFRSPLFPLFPAVYSALAAVVVAGNLWTQLGSDEPEVVLIGVLVVAAGALSYPVFMRRATS